MSTARWMFYLVKVRRVEPTFCGSKIGFSGASEAYKEVLLYGEWAEERNKVK